MTKRLLGLDVGSERIGVAVTDELGMFAHPRARVLCGKKKEFQELKRIIAEFLPERIIVGLPLELSGKKGAQTEYVEKFCAKLSGYLSDNPALRAIPIIFHDERLSSAEAERYLRGNKHRKSMTDSVAAVIILESYLQQHKFNNEY
jgi:putative Holliday junction resolvase